jgi:hypothetical protein
MSPPPDERSREEPADRDAVAPKADLRIHPSAGERWPGDPLPAD